MFNDMFDKMFDEAFSTRQRYYSNLTKPTMTQINALDAKNMARQAHTEVTYLNQKVERLMMITEALWTILKETTEYTDEDLVEIIREIDLKDGKLDGKVAQEPPELCPKCKRVLQKNKKNCIYCGSEIEIKDVFKR